MPITIPAATYAGSVAAPSDEAGALESLAVSEFLPGLRSPNCTLQPASLPHIAALAPYRAGLSLQEKIVLGIFFPALFLTLPIVTAFVWYKSYKDRVSDGERRGAFSERDSESCSSQKAELEVGEINQQRVSIVVQKTYETAGYHGKVEMPEGRGEHGILPSLLAKHELKGEEHSKELEAPSQECKE